MLVPNLAVCLTKTPSLLANPKQNLFSVSNYLPQLNSTHSPILHTKNNVKPLLFLCLIQALIWCFVTLQAVMQPGLTPVVVVVVALFNRLPRTVCFGRGSARSFQRDHTRMGKGKKKNKDKTQTNHSVHEVYDELRKYRIHASSDTGVLKVWGNCLDFDNKSEMYPKYVQEHNLIGF